MRKTDLIWKFQPYLKGSKSVTFSFLTTDCIYFSSFWKKKKNKNPFNNNIPSLNSRATVVPDIFLKQNKYKITAFATCECV